MVVVIYRKMIQWICVSLFFFSFCAWEKRYWTDSLDLRFREALSLCWSAFVGTLVFLSLGGKDYTFLKDCPLVMVNNIICILCFFLFDSSALGYLVGLRAGKTIGVLSVVSSCSLRFFSRITRKISFYLKTKCRKIYKGRLDNNYWYLYIWRQTL
jgi:hypothetical protein